MNEAILVTSSGREIDLNNVTSEAIALDDIAGALSQICRFGGLCTRFYSVAQHAVTVAEIVANDLQRPDLAFEALHHDSHEAYAGDLPRPLKLFLTGEGRTSHAQLCQQLDAAIAEALGFQRSADDTADRQVITLADNKALVAEAVALLPGGVAQIRGAVDLTDAQIAETGPAPEPLVPAAAKLAFLKAHSILSQNLY